MAASATLVTNIAIVLGFVSFLGPATLMIITRSVSSGSKVGVATTAGITFGDLMHTLFAVVSIFAIIAAKKAFKQDVIVDVLNPKTVLFFLAFLPQFVDPVNGSVAL